jgi:hypothetical protein
MGARARLARILFKASEALTFHECRQHRNIKIASPNFMLVCEFVDEQKESTFVIKVETFYNVTHKKTRPCINNDSFLV